MDIEYPRHLHDELSDLPFFPTNECIKENKHTKLHTTLENEKRYVLYDINQKQGINHGLEITKFQTTFQFYLTLWLQKYINLNTLKR